MILDIVVKPGAKKEGLFFENDHLVVKVRAKPVEGEANKAVQLALADFFGVAKSDVELVSGAKSKTKRFAISSRTRDDRTLEHMLETIKHA